MWEVWKPIVGFEGLYEVSNWGRVRRLMTNHGNQRKEPKTLKLGKVGRGYLHVILCKDGKLKGFLVHRLVATAFLPNPLNLPQVNHKDENHLNNVVFLDESGVLISERSNLEWCTQKYNSNYGTHNARVAKTLTNHPDLSKRVIQYDKSGNLIQEWPSMIEAERQMGFFASHISVCCKGKYKTAYGFVWRYAD